MEILEKDKSNIEETSRLPIDPVSGKQLPPRAQPGYYPGYSTLSQKNFWDEATRKVILDRVENIPPFRFFSSNEAELLQVICARLLPQDDRDESHKIPIANQIDKRLFQNKISGYRYDNMPSDRIAHQRGLQAIDESAKALYGRSFLELKPLEQDQILLMIHDGKPPIEVKIWETLPPTRYWTLLLQDVVEAYYAHPYAWDEIGFGGPAYPRGYMRLEGGKPEPWEVEEQRYDWEPPPTTFSDEYTPIGGEEPLKSEVSGQGGTH